MLSNAISNKTVGIVLTGYKRPEGVARQLEALRKSSIRPAEIILWENDSGNPGSFSALYPQFDNVIVSAKNVGVWSRFYAALTLKTDFVCVFDDDTIPGEDWLKNCLDSYEKKAGIYGTIGLIFSDNENYFNRRRVGWDGNTTEITEVDIVGHAWFMPRKLLGILSEVVPRSNFSGEDMWLSYLAQQQGIKTYVPPHPPNCKNLWGSIEAHRGCDKVALSNTGFNEFQQDFKLLVDQKWQLINQRKTKNEIWVAGFPSLSGGADTELLANVELFREKGVDVHLVPMFGMMPEMQRYLQGIGCKTHIYSPEIFEDKFLLSYCNGEFLKALPTIMEKGKPNKVCWMNCMTWLFDMEKTAHEAGWVDYFGFVSDYQRNILVPQLEHINPKVGIFENYQPYFNKNSPMLDLPFKYRESETSFGVGRISRADPAKFSKDMWDIFCDIISPKPKEIFILGYNEKVESKTGKPPETTCLAYKTWPEGVIKAKEFYAKLHVLLHKTGGSRESYCRVIPEAYSCGIPVIVENDYAFPQIVIEGETGFRCENSAEMSYRASQLAFDERLRKKMCFQAREFFENNMANSDSCWAPWAKILSEP